MNMNGDTQNEKRLTEDLRKEYTQLMHKLRRSKQVNMRVTPQLHELLAREADSENISIAELLQKAFHFYSGYKYGLTQQHHKPQK
jgi:predicted HicB family RNase H-like nuclease